jgi:GNAT superfamily N-acetyltransferase
VFFYEAIEVLNLVDYQEMHKVIGTRTLDQEEIGESEITFRVGTVIDSYTVFNIFEQSLADLSRRLGSTTPTSASDPEALAKMWQERRSIYEHLARTADEFWIAERDDRAIGFARSIVRDGHQELTELFVLPDEQSSGLGRRLLERAFPRGETSPRAIIASPDMRAQALYLKAGVYPRFPIYDFSRRPEQTAVNTDLNFKSITASPERVEEIGLLDNKLLGHRRDEDHWWLLGNKQGYLYYRGDRVVGYGYVGRRSGPFALLDASDYPAVLSHAENQVTAQGQSHFGLEVPMVNQTAVDHLLARGFIIGSFAAQFMSDEPFGNFENYIVTTPPFII